MAAIVLSFMAVLDECPGSKSKKPDPSALKDMFVNVT